MSFLLWFLGVLTILILIIFIFGFPRKKSERIPSLEGIDNPDVAKAYERMTNFLPFKLLQRKIVSHLKKFHPQGLLVDIGCGSGNLIVQIAEKFPNLKLGGVDISNEILELARKRADAHGLGEKIEFKLGNATKLPFPDASVDFIISTFSMHHWTNPLDVLNEIYRVLKKDGTFLIFDFRRDARKFFYGLFTFVTKVVVPKPLKRVKEPLGSIKASYTPEEALQICAQSPFATVMIKPFLAWMFISSKK